MQDDIQPLIDHLSSATALPPNQARRLLQDVLAYFDETAEDFVIRRHAELQASGLRNDAIFSALADEVGRRRFASRPLSKRQLRRLVYG